MVSRIRFLGSCREVGRAAILIDEVLLDYGIKPTEPVQYPVNGLRPRDIIISHGHLDHCGLLPNLMDLNPTIYMTAPSRDFCLLLAQDILEITEQKCYFAPFEIQDIQRVRERTQIVEYNQSFEVEGFKAMLFDAGHIPGSASVYLKGEKKIFYTSDFNLRETRLLNGCRGNFPFADILIIEGTYFNKEHPPRSQLEKHFIARIEQTLDRGGIALIPCFAIGRTQEILLVLNNYGLKPYLDGMGLDVCQILLNWESYLKDPKGFKLAFQNAIIVKPEMRSEIIKSPNIIITTAGMLNGGPVLYYLSRLHSDPRNSLLLTGYQAEGTNGKAALERKQIEISGSILDLKMNVEYFDFSAHCGDVELKTSIQRFIENGVREIFIVHSERAVEFASWIEQNYDVNAIAPKNGDEFEIE
ncbi:MAG: MBL fold metallo-hydrolase [Methanocellales archaeon]